MKCLCCGKPITNSATNVEKEWCWHKKCVKRFFQTDELPILDITKEKSFPKEIFTKKRNKDQSNKAAYCNLMTCKFFGANLHIAGQNGPLWLDEKEFINNKIDVLYQKVGFVEYRQYPQKEIFLKKR